jgi:hypothetical protein
MSQENVEIVRQAIEARSRDLDEWMAFFDPGVRSSDELIAVGMQTETQGSMSCEATPRSGRSPLTSFERRSWSSEQERELVERAFRAPIRCAQSERNGGQHRARGHA